MNDSIAMMNRFVCFTLLLCLLNGLIPAMSQEKQEYKNEIEWKQMPEIPPAPGSDKQPGLTGLFAGVSNGALLVGGGANYENSSPEQEEREVLYQNDIYILTTDENDNYRWITGNELPVNVAHGVSIGWGNGLLCVGGKNKEGALTSVYNLQWDAENSNVNIEEFPSLPFKMTSMGGDVLNGTVYLVGRRQNADSSVAFLKLNIKNAVSQHFEWEVLSFMSDTRINHPLGITQNYAEEKQFFLIDGSRGWAYSPGNESWRKINNARTEESGDTISLKDASGIPVGIQHILFVGSEIESEKQDKLIAYHTITDTWSAIGNYPYIPAKGSSMVKWDGNWFVIGGEVEPGEASPKVYMGRNLVSSSFGFINWAVIAIYIIGMLYIGYFFMGRTKLTNDYFKGGNRVPWWVAGFSIFATMASAISIMAIPAKSFATDWLYYPLAITILIIAFPVIKYYLPFFRRLNVNTAYEYLEIRFNYGTRALASLLFLIFMVARMALVLYLPSLALTTVAPISIETCIIIMGLSTILYCTMGGVEAVVWGDFIQGVVMIGGLILAVIFLLAGTEGGLTNFIDITQEYEKMKTFNFAFSVTKTTFWVVLLGGLANNLVSYSADQTVVQRYLTTKDEKRASKSILMNGILSAVVSLLYYFIGTALFAYYKTNPQELDIAMVNTDAILPHFILANMPLGIAGLMIAAIFSATMSTVSSNVNSISTTFTSDFYQKIFPKSSDKIRLRAARIAGVVFGLLGVGFALIMTTWNILSLFDFFQTILGLLASGLAALFIMGIFIDRIQAQAALWGFIFGTAFLFWIRASTDIHLLLYGVVGLLSCVTFGYIFSFIMPGERKQIKGITYKTLVKKEE